MHGQTAQTDRALVAAALADGRAYAAIVQRFEATLTRYVRRLLGRHGQSAGDVMQEVFIKAYVNLNDFDQERPFSPWIYRIAHNEAIGFLRKRKAEPQVIDGEDGQMILERISSGGDFAEAARIGDLEADARSAMAGLEPRYRDVLVLRYLEDKSYDEISDILHMPPGTVATRLQRGLKQLRAALGATSGSARA